MSTSRKAHQCTHPGGCDSAACWELDLHFHTVKIGNRCHEVKCASTIRVCGRHTDAAVARILSTPNKFRMAKWMVNQNLPIPDFDSFEFNWMRIDHKDIDREMLDARLSEDVETQLRQ